MTFCFAVRFPLEGMGSKLQGGPVSPLTVDLTNSPNVGWQHMVFLLGGHIGPPLRQVVRMGRNDPTCFAIEIPDFWKKSEAILRKCEESVHAQCWDIAVGADLCVRSW